MKKLTKEMKDWFGDNGEIDVDLMLESGVLTEETIIDWWENDPDSPGYIAIANLINKPPSNCPLCNGEREWDGVNRAVCYFCGLVGS